MTDTQRQRRANILAWCAILVAVGCFLMDSRGWTWGGGSEKLRAEATVSAQQAMLTSVINGAKSSTFGGAFAGQLSAFREQVHALASDDEPGSQLATAALLVRLDDRAAALELLASLRRRIDDGTVEADAAFMRVFDGVRDLVDAAGSPGSREVDRASCAAVEEALGPTGTMLVALANGDDSTLSLLAANGSIALAVLVVIVLGGCLLALGGIAGLVVFVTFAALGKTSGIGRLDTPHSHVYAEMFAVWLGALLLLGRIPRSLFGFLAHQFEVSVPMGAQLVLSVVATVAAAGLALWWGTRRGLSLRTIAAGVGMRRFRAMDVAWGLVCWSMGLALLVVGLLVAMLLAKLFSGGQLRATHPIQQMVEESGPFGLFLTYLLACASAPLFEELFFRGAMYRNLRQSLGRWGPVGSVALSALVSSAIFAAIHPQGLVFAPVLGGLAVGFCIMREWRGTINASIVAHAMNNLTVLSLNVLMLRH